MSEIIEIINGIDVSDFPESIKESMRRSFPVKRKSKQKIHIESLAEKCSGVQCSECADYSLWNAIVNHTNPGGHKNWELHLANCYAQYSKRFKPLFNRIRQNKFDNGKVDEFVPYQAVVIQEPKNDHTVPFIAEI